jgi:hypothetical protein
LASDVFPAGRLLLCGIDFAFICMYSSLRALSTTVSLSPQGDMTCGRSVSRVVHQAERSDAMKQIIISRNDKEDVWVETPTGNLLAECFFKAPEETPEELEHMGYPQLLHLYPPEEMLVGPGIAPEEVEEIFVEA